MTIRAARLLLGCTALGAGVALLLTASSGSDGYSTLINGLSLQLSTPFWVTNVVLGAALISIVWMTGTRPGLGTVTQPIVSGVAVSVLLPVLDTPATPAAKAAMVLGGLLVLSCGVATYLTADLGAGPVEAAAVSLDPPVGFRVSYGLVHGGGALIGWSCGAAVGWGTLLVIAVAGPTVAWLTAHVPGLRIDR